MPKKSKNHKQHKQSNNWFFSACHSPKYPSDPPLTRTVRSKHHHRDDDITDTIRAIGSYQYGPLDSSPRLTELPRGSISGSDRFFIPDPDVTSKSLLEEARLSNGKSTENGTISGYPVVEYSEDPREDFRNSMVEMFRSRHMAPGEPLNWEMLEELLFAYLEVNERDAYRYIYAAFADLIVGLSRHRSAACDCHCKRRHSFG